LSVNSPCCSAASSASSVKRFVGTAFRIDQYVPFQAGVG
jgi:hypothetical protein